MKVDTVHEFIKANVLFSFCVFCCFFVVVDTIFSKKIDTFVQIVDQSKHYFTSTFLGDHQFTVYSINWPKKTTF